MFSQKLNLLSAEIIFLVKVICNNNLIKRKIKIDLFLIKKNHKINKFQRFLKCHNKFEIIRKFPLNNALNKKIILPKILEINLKDKIHKII